MSFEPLVFAKTIELSEAATQTLVTGNLVYQNGSGYIAECGADPASIYGIAAEAGHNTVAAGTNTLAVYRIRPGELYVAKSNTTTDQAHVGLNYGVVNDSSVWKVDISETVNTRVFIHALDPRDAVGTSGGRYWVEFRAANLQSSK